MTSASPGDSNSALVEAAFVPDAFALAAAFEPRRIDARSVVTLVVFFAVNLVVIFPLRIPLPRAIGSLARWVRDTLLGLGPAYDPAHSSHGHANGADNRGGDGGGSHSVHRVHPEAKPLEELHPEVDPTEQPRASKVIASEGVQAAARADSDRTLGQGDFDYDKAAQGPPSSSSTTATVTPSATHSATASVSVSGSTPTAAATHRAHEDDAAFELGLATAPVAGVLLVLASTCIPGSVVRGGIVGGVRPYDIMTLFLSFAYISLSLDCTGLLRYLAFTVAERSSSSGKALFFALYALFVVLSLAVGNDPVVLSGTPFVAYFTSHARITPPTPFLFAQFQAANLASALLVSSNPTNLVLTSSFHLSFLSFSAWTALPTIAAAVALYPVLAYLYRNLIPHKIDPPKVVPRDALVDPFGALFTSTVFISAIVALVALSAVGKLEGVEGVWTVTAPAALLVLFRDGVHDLRKGRSGGEAIAGQAVEMEMVGPARKADNEAGEPVLPPAAAGIGHVKSGIELHSATPVRRRSSVVAAPPSPSPTPSLDAPRKPPSSPSPSSDFPSPTGAKRPRHPVAWLRHTFPTVSAVVARLPLPLLPFAFSMFILVDALEYTGWVVVWAKWWAAWARAGGTAGCIWLMGVISVLGCNIFGTNIGLTVLLSRILVVWRDATSPSNRTLYGSVLSLAIGSNFGAYSFVFSASLAGLLWRDILAQKGLSVAPIEFMRWNMVPLWTTMAVACLVVGAEVCVMF